MNNFQHETKFAICKHMSLSTSLSSMKQMQDKQRSQLTDCNLKKPGNSLSNTFTAWRWQICWGDIKTQDSKLLVLICELTNYLIWRF